MQKVFYVSGNRVQEVNDELRRYNTAKVVHIIPVTQIVSAGSSMHQEGEIGAYIVIEY